MQTELFTLPNGLRVILIDTKAFPTMTTVLFFGTGSRFENEKNNGIAHFLEHMPFKGSKKYPSFFAISSLLEGLGAVHNAYTSKDHTAFWVKAPTTHTATVLDVLADMILNPLLKEEEIEREKGVIVQEMNMFEDSPQRKVSDLFENLLYGKQALGRDIIGKKDTVTKFTRNTFTDYMNAFYHPDNAVLVLAGGLGQGKGVNFMKMVEDKFGYWNTKLAKDLKAPKTTEHQNSPKTLIHYKKTEQTHFSLGFRTFSFRDKRKYALSLFSTILGGGSSSRLFIEVRERRGLCYYIHSGKESYQDVGYMTSQAGVNNDKDKINEAISVILVEHKKMTEGKITDEELIRAKEMIKGRILLSMEDSSNIATWYGTKLILENKTETVEEVIEKLDKVSKEEVVEVAKDIVRPEKLNLALIGPFNNEDFRGLLTNDHGL